MIKKFLKDCVKVRHEKCHCGAKKGCKHCGGHGTIELVPGGPYFILFPVLLLTPALVDYYIYSVPLFLVHVGVAASIVYMLMLMVGLQASRKEAMRKAIDEFTEAATEKMWDSGA